MACQRPAPISEKLVDIEMAFLRGEREAIGANVYGQPWIGWAGACAGTSPTCTLTMDANKSVTANFR